MMISGERTKQLDIFCRVTGFTSDFLSFIDVELIRFFHSTLQLSEITECWVRVTQVSRSAHYWLDLLKNDGQII